MKFTLMYDGPLESSGNKPKKEDVWKIRKEFDPQLRNLWEIDRDLTNLKLNSRIRADGHYLTITPHHLSAAESPVMSQAMMIQQSGSELTIVAPPEPVWIDLCEPIPKGNKSFFPLVRNTLALTCGLKIQFLRQGEKGKAYQDGDLDGRLKTLLDALSMPNQENQMCEDAACPEPLYCLAENDALFTRIDVETERLLSPKPNANKHDVRLIVTVDVRASRSRPYNAIFLGD